jgi:hypothetical protein
MMVATVEFELLDGTNQVTSIVPGRARDRRGALREHFLASSSI